MKKQTGLYFTKAELAKKLLVDVIELNGTERVISVEEVETGFRIKVEKEDK